MTGETPQTGVAVRYETTPIGDVAIVPFSNDDYGPDQPFKRAALEAVSRDEVAELIIDFDGVDFIDQHGLGNIIGLHKRTVINGRMGLSLANLDNRNVEKIFEITGLDKVLNIEKGLDLGVRPDWLPALEASRHRFAAAEKQLVKRAPTTFSRRLAGEAVRHSYVRKFKEDDRGVIEIRNGEPTLGVITEMMAENLISDPDVASLEFRFPDPSYMATGYVDILRKQITHAAEQGKAPLVTYLPRSFDIASYPSLEKHAMVERTINSSRQ